MKKHGFTVMIFVAIFVGLFVFFALGNTTYANHIGHSNKDKVIKLGVKTRMPVEITACKKK